MESSGNWNDVLGRIKGELSNLAKFVEKTKAGIDNIETTVKIGSEKFPDASKQLNAVTGDLENAANNIMNILEGLMQEQDNCQGHLKKLTQNLSGKLAPEDSALLAQIDGISIKAKTDMMNIFTNLSFQDLTGQKLKKVIGSLAVVESKLLELAFAFGFNGEGAANGAGAPSCDKSPELKGPTNEMAIDQSLVDKLLKELGA